MRRQISAILALCLLVCACRGRPLAEPVDLVLPRAQNGQPYSFAAHRGQPLVVYFFATWCVPCVAMEASVVEAAKKAKGRRVSFVAVALDREGAKIVRPYALASDLPFPVLVGGGGVAEGRSPFGKIPELPSVLILDSGGRPATSFTGVASSDFLLERVEEVRDRS